MKLEMAKGRNQESLQPAIIYRELYLVHVAANILLHSYSDTNGTVAGARVVFDIATTLRIIRQNATLVIGSQQKSLKLQYHSGQADSTRRPKIGGADFLGSKQEVDEYGVDEQGDHYSYTVRITYD